jgi:tape measure domain-containing protein
MTAAATVTRVIEVDVKASANAAAHLKQISDQMGGLEKTAKQTQLGMSQFFDFAKNAVRGFVGLFVAGQITSFVLELNKLNDESKILIERMKQVSSSNVAAGDAFLEITRIAREQGREIDGVAKLYEKAARNAEVLGISTRAVSMLTEGFAASLRLSGSTTQEANAAMIQFGQVLASGRFQGDEFRSMMENNSVFMFELAKAAGVTMEAIREMSKDGKLNAEFLREALFKMGADGRNMLQQLLERAERLPKTFDQAMAGVKASLVELLGALNETAGEAEGIFTRLAKAVSSNLSEAARLIREETLIKNEELKALGKEVPKEPTQTDKAALQDIALADRRYQTVLQLQAQQKRMQDLLNAGMDRESATIKQLEQNITRFKGTIQGLDKVLEDRERKVDAKSSQLLVNGWKPTPPSDKKKKGREEKDWLEEAMDDLNKAEAFINYAEEHMGKHQKKFEENIRKFAEETSSKYTLEQVQAIIRQGRARAIALDTAERETDFQKFLEKVLRDDLERATKTGEEEIEKFKSKLEGYVRKGRRLNPLIEIEDEIEDIKKTLSNPLVSPEQADLLTKYMADLREKLAQELLGTKEVVKTTAEQMGDAWGNAFDQMIEDLLEFDKSAEELITNLVVHILKEFARIEMSKAMQPLMNAGKDAMTKFFESLFTSANGSAFTSGGVRMFADGGVVNAPTGFTYGGGQKGVMGEAGPEAIMPLRRGADGKLGVGTAPVSITINNNGSGTRARTEERTDGSGNREILVIIEDVVESALGGGRFDSVLNNSFSVTRKGK